MVMDRIFLFWIEAFMSLVSLFFIEQQTEILPINPIDEVALPFGLTPTSLSLGLFAR